MMNKGFNLLAEKIEGFYKRVLDGDIRIVGMKYKPHDIEFGYECVRTNDSGTVGTGIDDACLIFLRNYDSAIADWVLEQEGY